MLQSLSTGELIVCRYLLFSLNWSQSVGVYTCTKKHLFVQWRNMYWHLQQSLSCIFYPSHFTTSYNMCVMLLLFTHINIIYQLMSGIQQDLSKVCLLVTQHLCRSSSHILEAVAEMFSVLLPGFLYHDSICTLFQE